jgi:hypothetical protein
MTVSEESPVECCDGCGGKDSHMPIIDHGGWRICSTDLMYFSDRDRWIYATNIAMARNTDRTAMATRKKYLYWTRPRGGERPRKLTSTLEAGGAHCSVE